MSRGAAVPQNFQHLGTYMAFPWIGERGGGAHRSCG